MFGIIIVINFLIENVKITDTQGSVQNLSIQNLHKICKKKWHFIWFIRSRNFQFAKTRPL